MIGKMSKVAVLGICAFIVAVASIHAEDAIEKKHVTIGERAEPVKERMAQRQAKALAVQEAKKTTQEKKVDAKTLAKGVRASSKSLAKGVYYTTHPGAYQHVVSISAYGDSLELMDGSIWRISPNYAYMTANWYLTDQIVITPNHSWFSPYDFRLTNQSTGASVPADMYLGPIDPAYNSPYTHWIVGIDYYYNDVYLEDGSVWAMSSFDGNIVDQWIVGDIVMIGVNDGWLSSSNPNILINVNLLNYAAGFAEY